MRDKREVQDLLHALSEVSVADWVDIDRLLDEFAFAEGCAVLPTERGAGGAGQLFRGPGAPKDARGHLGIQAGRREGGKPLTKAVAFITFDYGIDGVSIEISKYAKCLENILSEDGGSSPIHLIGGDFTEKAEAVIAPNWHRFILPNSNGWDKWEGGRWFSKLFYEDMPAGSDTSAEMAVEIWRQALGFTREVCGYLTKNEIELLIPVNVSSNPGNLALALAVVLTAGLTGASVLNSNHDFYWEGGKPRSERAEGEAAGVRDHFFRNHENGPFFKIFERILPWNGQTWLQVNINRRQSEILVRRYGFAEGRVYEVGTAVDDAFLDECTDRYNKRLRMAYILSDGNPVIRPVPVDAHLVDLGDWMKRQVPIVCGVTAGLELDIATPASFYFLQPTRIIGRKRIERNWQLIGALMQYAPFREAFEGDPHRTLTLHITGPVPIEHQADLERVLNAYKQVTDSLPDDVARRLFLAFSVGHEDHPALAENNLERLYIQDIFQLADVVVFPSETEGRGLPIVESSAAGVPIVCSRYRPESVFAEVVGEHLGEELCIQYTLFPEGGFSASMLQEVTDVVLFPERLADRIAHNRVVVAKRYSMQALQDTFKRFLEMLAT